MIFRKDWQLILTKAWSVKFGVLAALLGGAEVAVSVIQPWDVPNGLFAAIAAIVSILATVARLMAQKEITNEPAK